MSLRLTAREYAQLRKNIPNLILADKKNKKSAYIKKIQRAPRVSNHAGPLLEVTVQVPIPPQVKQRARTAPDKRALANAFLAAAGNLSEFLKRLTGFMHSSTPKATRVFEASVRAAAAAVMSKNQMAPFSCPVEMEVRFCFPGDPATWPTAPADGDLDNLNKAIKDAINKVVYVDDRLVVHATQTKECGEHPLVSFTVRPVSV